MQKDAQDIIELLYEIKRSRVMILKIDRVQRSTTVSGGLSPLLESLRSDLRSEPCVQEDVRLRSE